MKKTLLIPALIVFALSSLAQSKPDKVISLSSLKSNHTAQGRVLITAATDLSYGSLTLKDGGEESESDNFNFESGAGLFLIDNLALTVFGSYERQENKSTLAAELNSSFMLGPSLIYYIGTADIKPYLQAEYMFGNIKNQVTIEKNNGGYGGYGGYGDYGSGYFTPDDISNKIKMSGWAVGGGMAFFLNHYLSLDIGLGYTEITSKPEDVLETDRKITGLAAQAGFSIYL